jgi:hypothetical protein
MPEPIFISQGTKPCPKSNPRRQSTQIAEHDPGIDTKRAVYAATCTTGAFRIGRIHAFLHESIVHIPFALDKLAEGGLDLIRRDLFGVFVVGKIIKTAFSTKTTVGTDLKPGFQA